MFMYLQVLWLTGEMVKTGVAGSDRLCFALLKQLPTGSSSPDEIYIAENLMHILLDNRLARVWIICGWGHGWSLWPVGACSGIVTCSKSMAHCKKFCILISSVHFMVVPVLHLQCTYAIWYADITCNVIVGGLQCMYSMSSYKCRPLICGQHSLSLVTLLTHYHMSCGTLCHLSSTMG